MVQIVGTILFKLVAQQLPRLVFMIISRNWPVSDVFSNPTGVPDVEFCEAFTQTRICSGEKSKQVVLRSTPGKRDVSC